MVNRRAFSVAVFCRNGGEILLVRHKRLDLWLPVGGEIEPGETPLEAARRELREETGLEVEPVELVGVWMDRYGGDATAEATLNLYWTARVVGGEPEAADDVSELGWFAPDELPLDELAFENVPKVLSAWRARQQHA